MIIKDRLNYLNTNISYYIGRVYEYDIRHAYPSLLKDTNFKFNDESLYDEIQNMNEYTDKRELLIRIGLELRENPNISIYLHSKLKEIINKFQEINNLDESNLISIKKDAIFTIKECNNLLYDDNVEFRIKNKYNLYFYEAIKRYEFYIINNSDNKYSYSIKGLGKDYDKYLWGIIIHIIYLSLSNRSLDIIKRIQQIFMNKEYNKCIKYCPEEVLYNNFVYINKNMLKEKDYQYVDFNSIFFNYYMPVFKTLINYII